MGERREILGVSGKEGNGEVAMGRVGEYACYTGALQVGEAIRYQIYKDRGERTVVGPAPIRIARPDGAILVFVFCMLKWQRFEQPLSSFQSQLENRICNLVNFSET